MMAAADTPRLSLKEKKQALVRSELAHAAWKLFSQHGYEGTTVEAIAQATGVSRRTFFRYYPSKEDVLIETSDKLALDLVDAVAARPVEELPLTTIRHALLEVLRSRFDNMEESRIIMRLMNESRTLRRAMLERHDRIAVLLTVEFAKRLDSDPRSDTTPALLAYLTKALISTALAVWHEQERTDVDGLVEELFSSTLDLARTIHECSSRRP